MKRALFPPAVVLLTIVGLHAASAQPAPPAKVFVAAQGSDSNPCTLVQPCLTFQHAHDTVAAGGVIDVLSPADYGVLIINKAISIQGHGFAGLAVTSGNGITINAGTSDKVSLRGLLIDGVGSGNSGIAFNTGASLDIQECLVRNFTADGIRFNALTQTAATSALLVSDTRVAANLNGIRVLTEFGNTPTGTLDRVVAVGNRGDGLQFFLRGTAPVIFTVSDSVFSNNSSNGVDVALQVTNPITVSLTLRNVVASNNAGTGVTVTGPSNFTHVLITKSTITGNALGIGGAQILSFGDNNIADIRLRQQSLHLGAAMPHIPARARHRSSGRRDRCA